MRKRTTGGFLRTTELETRDSNGSRSAACSTCTLPRDDYDKSDRQHLAVCSNSSILGLCYSQPKKIKIIFPEVNLGGQRKGLAWRIYEFMVAAIPPVMLLVVDCTHNHRGPTGIIKNQHSAMLINVSQHEQTSRQPTLPNCLHISSPQSTTGFVDRAPASPALGFTRNATFAGGFINGCQPHSPRGTTPAIPSKVKKVRMKRMMYPGVTMW